jgi:hypothetical protein
MGAGAGATVFGGEGNDIIGASLEGVAYGGAGADEMRASFGQYYGGGGYENTSFLTGGDGDDRFVVSETSAEDPINTSLTVISDFNPAAERLSFEIQNSSEISPGSLSVTTALDAGGGSTTVTISAPAEGGGTEVLTRIRLLGVTSFAASDLRIEFEPLED